MKSQTVVGNLAIIPTISNSKNRSQTPAFHKSSDSPSQAPPSTHHPKTSLLNPTHLHLPSPLLLPRRQKLRLPKIQARPPLHALHALDSLRILNLHIRVPALCLAGQPPHRARARLRERPQRVQLGRRAHRARRDGRVGIVAQQGAAAATAAATGREEQRGQGGAKGAGVSSRVVEAAFVRVGVRDARRGRGGGGRLAGEGRYREIWRDGDVEVQRGGLRGGAVGELAVAAGVFGGMGHRLRCEAADFVQAAEGKQFSWVCVFGGHGLRWSFGAVYVDALLGELRLLVCFVAFWH